MANMDRRHSQLITLVGLLLLIVASTRADRRNPMKDPNICGRPMCEDNGNNKFQHRLNVKYKYDYRMHVRSEFAGSGENSSDLFVTGSVTIEFPKRCEGVLTIADIELREQPIPEPVEEPESDSDDYVEYEPPEEIELHPKSADFAYDISQHKLRFAYHDGVIGEVCPTKEEPIWVLNFKKGVLSSFQNSMQRFDVDLNTTEVDVSGSCNVFYNLMGAQQTSLIIQKTKDLGSCTHRYKTHSILQTTPYDFRKNQVIFPILQSKSFCNVSVDDFVYNDITCYERHILVPFSNNQSGAVTESRMRLTLVDEETSDVSPYRHDNEAQSVESRSTLLFNHAPSPKPTHGEIKASRDLLKQMCKLGFPDIQRDFIDVFSSFLTTAKLLSHQALQQLLARATSICESGKNHVLESLPYIGSTASVRLMRDQIVKGQVPQDVVFDWLTSLSFITRPDEEMLDTFYSLMEFGRQKIEPEYTLTSSAVVHTFCRHNPDCANTKPVKKIIKLLEAEVVDNLALNVERRDVRERLIVVLKALGNIGWVSPSLQVELKKLIEDENIPVIIRLQAISSHRRIDCEGNKDYFLDFYRNFSANPEIRMASYLQAMRCPNYVSIETIKYVLNHEEVNQVGSFVWSHLSNIAKSSSPVRVAAQGLLIDSDLGTKYRLDIRKFSRNFEHSLFFDEYNFGLNSDANLIFGTDSYMPRAFTFNFTADLFGESVNLFEISARMQGFEHLIESFFGPAGPMNANKVREKFGLLTKYFKYGYPEEDDFDKMSMRFKRTPTDDGLAQNRSISRRSSRGSNDLMNNDIKKLGYGLKYDFKDPKAAFGFKMFGNDLKYKTIEGLPEIGNMIQQFNLIKRMNQVLSGKEITYTKSGVFLDASYDVPLSSGLPLSIHAFGASSVDMRMSGSLNNLNFDKKIQLAVEGKFKPSISVDVIGTMQADLFYGTSGIRVKSNLYSSSTVEMKALVDGKKMGSLEISLPQDRNEIFSARSQLLVQSYQKDIPQKGIERRYTNSSCTWPVIDRAVGLKICSEYSLPDLANTTGQYPSLIFSGPIDLHITLDKADLTAKRFVFQYRWDESETVSRGLFVFDTPGSLIPRILSTNITKAADTWNLTMAFRNGDTAHSAVGTYKNTEREKKFEVYLNLNGQKNLALEMGLNRSDITYGNMYYPKFLLSVNDERIAGMVGTVKAIDKKGISQYDVTLAFETKRLMMRVTGNIMKGSTVSSVKLKTDYTFLDNKPQTIEFDAELSDKSNRGKTDYQGSAKMVTSAYAHLNFASNFSFISLYGHFEAKLDVNNAPDLIDPRYTTSMAAMLVRIQSEDRGSTGVKTSASFELKRPIQNRDIKFMIKHMVKIDSGTKHNFVVIFRFAPKKEATAITSLHFPRSNMFAVRLNANVTVPTFDSCTVTIKLTEKAPRDYDIDFHGSWFSGHSINVTGAYQDKSSVIKSYHHLKVVARSPSFEETNIDVKYWRDEKDLTFSLQTEYNHQPYGLTVRHSEPSEIEKTSYAEIKFRERIYWMTANLRSEQPKQLFVELHVDKLRDIHLILRGLNADRKKEAGIEVKWDANRDPTQKLEISVEFNTPEMKKYDGMFKLSYPERTFSGIFDMYTGGPEYNGNAKISWSQNEAIEIEYQAGTNFDDVKDLWLRGSFRTPFDGWRQNSLSSGLYHMDNLLLVNGSLLWAESQKVSVAFLSDYETFDPAFKGELKLEINSTIKDVPTINAHLKHSHDNQRIDTNLKIKHQPLNETINIFIVESIWQVDTDVSYNNVTGTVKLRSPFDGYTVCALATKFSMSDKRQLKGAIDLDVEEKKFTLVVDGHIKKITDSMLVVNVTTPIEKFRNIVGRFGINEREKHVVAEIRAPSGALGIETLYVVNTVSDFDIKFNLETPLEAFERIMLIGKMKSDTVDFRGGWNKAVLGFVGVWRQVNITDFEYSYKVYTPLENFEESGIVFKNKFYKKDDFTTEMWFRLAKYKAGLKIDIHPKSKVFSQLKFKTAHALLRDSIKDKVIKLKPSEGEEEEDEGSYEQEYYDRLLNFQGTFEVDALIYPTVIGEIDVEEDNEIMFISGNIRLPKGAIQIRDNLYFPDYMNMRNSLKINSPFAWANEVHFLYEHAVEIGEMYISHWDFEVLHNAVWVNASSYFNYSIVSDEGDLNVYDIYLQFKTPLKLLPKLVLKGNVEMEETVYRGNFSTQTIDTAFSMAGSMESDENFLETTFELQLDTPLVPNYLVNITFKKDFSEIENSLDLGYTMRDNLEITELKAKGIWLLDDTYFKAIGKVETNILPIKLSEISIYVTKVPNPLASMTVSYTNPNGSLSEFRLRANRKKEYVSVEINTPINDFRNVSLHGTIAQMHRNQEVYRLLGKVYRNLEVYNINGTVRLNDQIPTEIKFSTIPQSSGLPGSVEIFINEVENSHGLTFRGRIEEGERFAQIGGGYRWANKFDWKVSLAMQSSEPEIGNLNVTTSMFLKDNEVVTGAIEAETPWSNLGLEHVKSIIEMKILSHSSKLNGLIELPAGKIAGLAEYSWLWDENMFFMIEGNSDITKDKPKSLRTGLKYLNPGKSNQKFTIGGLVDVNSLWILDANGTLVNISSNDYVVNFGIQLPKPFDDVHRLSARYRGDFGQKSYDDISYELKYEAENAHRHYASRGQYRNVTDLQGLLRVEWGHDVIKEALESNFHMLRKGDRREFSVRLATPYYDEDTFSSSGHYDNKNYYRSIATKINYPASRQVAETDVTWKDFSNMHGLVNTTVPFLNITWIRSDFNLSATNDHSKRFIKVTWPLDTAIFQSQSTFRSENLNRDLKGTMTIEVPLATRHIALIDYGIKERPLITTGHATATYNTKNVLNGLYTCKSETHAGFNKQVVDISLENDLKPIGIHYIHVMQYGEAHEPHYDTKRTEVFELRNSKLANITGEIFVKTTQTGQEYKIVAIHPNRTVILTTDYDYVGNVTVQSSKLQLAPTVWISYKFKGENLSTFQNESQIFDVELSYPKRNLSIGGWYSVTENMFDSDLSFKWTHKEEKTKGFFDDDEDEVEEEAVIVPRIMRAAVQWRMEPLHGIDRDNQTAVFVIRHPSFAKDVTINCSFYRSPVDLLKSKFVVDYCDEPDHLLTFGANIKDWTSLLGYRNYTLHVFGDHEISELDLDVRGSISGRPGFYETVNSGKYKRGYLPLQEGFLIGFLNFENKEINYHKKTPFKTVRFWSKADGSFPAYRAQMEAEDSPDVNSVGVFYVDFADKYVRLEVNMTPDASQNLQMIGTIPDARSAYFDLWRDYEDIHVTDITYYLKMNHSRLITSQLYWRPQLKGEIKDKIRGTAASFYETMSETIDFWIKTLYTESVDTMNDLWTNAKPHTQVFLDDVGGLRVLEDDIEEFRKFLNQSYEANDFYIKTAINFTLTVIDELAIRDHVESLPKILSEVWQVMGDSGKALRNSILWLIETVKTSYKKAIEMIGRILHGEGLEHLSAMMEKGVAKYDKFIKDLHLSLIKYVENLWNKTMDLISNYWRRSLQKIEPSIIKFLHYVETVVWNISREIFDFLYKRTNELVESPYFNQVSNFTQDLDRLYKDLMANDAITNIKKYSVLAWQFLKEKYFKLVPFGKELHEVIVEVSEEIKALQKIESVQFVIQKVNEVQESMVWIADQFQLEKRILQLWKMFRRKIARFTQTALQTDDHYREAKTRFIFDPDNGAMELEQKLPMSWHAFNETPKFEEIPEYKLIIDIQNFFAGSNFSIWNVYYDVKRYTDPHNWLPPFKSYSLLVGSRHYMTFDQDFVTLDLKYDAINSMRKTNKCSYLLAHDFSDGNFTLLLEPSILKKDNDLYATRKFALLTEGTIVDIDIIGNTVRIGRNVTSALPVQIGQATIYRESDILTISSSKEFSFHCNLQFDVCWFELGGWYFGKTAGILGTMNNEVFDDSTTSKNALAHNTQEFINSWALNNCEVEANQEIAEIPSGVKQTCDNFFKSKLSQFFECYNIVNPGPFYEMCLDLGTNSISNIINDNHPSQKGACAAALAYIEACGLQRTPLRIPEICVHCLLVNGTYVPEGTFVRLENADVPRTSDVVFIVEAKECNKNMTLNKSIMTVVNALNMEFNNLNITNNRYSVVAFGGPAPFDKPRSIVFNNEVFTDFSNLTLYFDHIKSGAGTYNDTFDAITFASKLIFRPGASKTFILLPCQSCLPNAMRLDYSSVVQVILEEKIIMHVLMDQNFGSLEKKRIERVLYGMDKQFAYTKRYLKLHTGDEDLRRQIRLPKDALGLCTPLATESQGTIFTSKKLKPENRNPVKKFASVFAMRVAQSAVPSSCQTCECTGHNSGVAYTTCTDCEVPNPMSMDYEFDDDEMLDLMQSEETDTGFDYMED